MEISVVDVSQQTWAEIVPLARKLSTHDKLVRIQVLADELLKQELLRPLKQIRAIEMWTPYDTVGAAQVLAQELTKSFDIHFYRSQLAFEINPKSPSKANL